MTDAELTAAVAIAFFGWRMLTPPLGEGGVPRPCPPRQPYGVYDLPDVLGNPAVFWRTLRQLAGMGYGWHISQELGGEPIAVARRNVATRGKVVTGEDPPRGILLAVLKLASGEVKKEEAV